ncbi:siderophore-interacting protein [Stenotrophomonas sp. GD03701]|uniref:Siderophore-interacting protein n=1 Tax=Stenotrophomonas maltophilia TaxID=40324 RepID=A0A2J0SYY9_STEMA|nr:MULTISPECIES: siderophore-interacting protein [Stenotrophomonas]MBA0310379.1 siderophore-interacting protein [Stenotrophomonas maltophilia]MDH1388733.1 siderophore-interacting protein [Stenotrophomonas sp. GD03701]MDH1393242.1 siderophore-interacting protein [Stenotrophomonas sp. GD03702]MDQ7301604.1 siderophore-interacting protein [Stenotrophomonas sp. Sm0581]PJL03351.1 siderophore-interacting protein [Stenotrophomonas maltophilia]
MAAQQTYRLFEVALKERRVLSPSLDRMVFTGADVARMKTEGPDQRIKVFFPLPGQDVPQVPSGEDWYPRYRALPDDQRPPIRTYTIRQLRAEQGEVDVDFVLHGETGPASRWAIHARPGDRVVLLAPDADCADSSEGWEWKPPAGVGQVLLVADETALPAVAGILEELAALADPPRTLALLEVAQAGDAVPLKAPSTAELVWLPRGQAAHGQPLLQAVQARLAAVSAVSVGDELEEIDVDAQILWEQADASVAGPLYAWVAGEAGAVMAIRRHLVRDCGLDRRAITFMGYWRHGKVLD